MSKNAIRHTAADGAGRGRAIVEAHGGRIWLTDPPAGQPGTRVRFSLPVAGASA